CALNRVSGTTQHLCCGSSDRFGRLHFGLRHTPAAPGKDTMTESAGTNTLSVTDNRTGTTYEIPIEDGAIRASALRQIKTDDAHDPGLLSFDPAFTATASCRSAITYIDG